MIVLVYSFEMFGSYCWRKLLFDLLCFTMKSLQSLANYPGSSNRMRAVEMTPSRTVDGRTMVAIEMPSSLTTSIVTSSNDEDHVVTSTGHQRLDERLAAVNRYRRRRAVRSSLLTINRAVADAQAMVRFNR